MGKKVEGMKKLEELGLPITPYVLIKPDEIDECEKKLNNFIPNKSGYAIGVCLRVSVPGKIDREKHGGLHLLNIDEIKLKMKEIGSKYIEVIFLINHCIDPKYSGTIMKIDSTIIIECLEGELAPLVEGRVTPEIWEKNLNDKWENVRSLGVLKRNDLNKFSEYINILTHNCILEWSVSKSGNIYFYEFLELETVGLK